MESVKRYSPYKEVKLLAEASEARRLETQAKLDRVSAENLALQQRLTVQDQRVDELMSLVQDFLKLVDQADQLPLGFGASLLTRVRAALNPTAGAESHDE